MKVLPTSSEEANKLLEAKIVFGQLFRFVTGHITLIVRALTISESETIISLSDQLEDSHLHDWILKRTLIYCNDVDYLMNNTKAGVVASIADKIMLISNINTEDAFKKEIVAKRESINTLQTVIESFISKAFQSLPPTTVKNLTQSQQLDYLCKAEALLGTKLELDKKPKRRRGPRIPDGYSSIGEAPNITSREAADMPDFDADSRGMNQ